MTLLEQFQVFVGLIFITFFFLLIWAIFDALLKEGVNFVIRLSLEIVLFLTYAYLYQIFISFYVDGVLNIFYILSILIAFYFFYKYYLNTVQTYIVNLKYKTKLKINSLASKMKMKKEKKEIGNERS